jgi:hypothetical protein
MVSGVKVPAGSVNGVASSTWPAALTRTACTRVPK